MKKPVYKLLDEKGRILIPKEFRQMAELESGDIVKLSMSSGKIVVSKVDIAVSYTHLTLPTNREV